MTRSNEHLQNIEKLREFSHEDFVRRRNVLGFNYVGKKKGKEGQTIVESLKEQTDSVINDFRESDICKFMLYNQEKISSTINDLGFFKTVFDDKCPKHIELNCKRANIRYVEQMLNIAEEKFIKIVYESEIQIYKRYYIYDQLTKKELKEALNYFENKVNQEYEKIQEIINKVKDIEDKRKREFEELIGRIGI